VFTNFWYVAEESAAVVVGPDGGPVHTRMLGQDFVLFRDTAGTVHCLSNLCVHRGASLAHGKVKGDCIECPYHGWQFNGADGTCAKIPSLGPDGKIPTRAKVDSYPVEERYGLIFVFLGDAPDADRPPILNMEEWDDPAWRWTYLNYTWPVNWQRAIENSLDPAHTEFVHPMMGYEGERDDYIVPALPLTEHPWGVGARRTNKSPTKSGSLKAGVRSGDREGKTDTGHVGPNQVWIWIHFTDAAMFHQYAFVTPIDAHTSRRYFFQARNFILEEQHDARVMARIKEIAEQDRRVLTEMRPAFTPSSTTEEVLVGADNVIVRFREFLKDWQANGWRIDEKAVAAADPEHKAFAIPSPQRRGRKGWVIDSVPVLATASEVAQAAE
jgi:phenylpropionate dioxygenase-like ring-hydroxylating dioxygenase large terminal subunit